MSEELNKLTGKILDVQKRKPADLVISRVPPRTIEEFKDLAHKDFCKDYGMTLKWLMDGLIKADVQELLTRIEELEERVIQLEATKKVVLPEEKKSNTKLLDGRELRGGTGK